MYEVDLKFHEFFVAISFLIQKVNLLKQGRIAEFAYYLIIELNN